LPHDNVAALKGTGMLRCNNSLRPAVGRSATAGEARQQQHQQALTGSSSERRQLGAW
jgi:hypothetical protein